MTAHETFFPMPPHAFLPPLPHTAHAALVIHKGALQQNYDLLASKASHHTIYPVLKADAYGLGAQEIAPLFLQKSTKGFFVAYMEEGIELRKVVPKHIPIYVLNGLFLTVVEEFFSHALTPVLTDIGTFSLWQNEAKKQSTSLSCVLHLDTAMNRTGMNDSEFLRLLNTPQWSKGLSFDFIMSHYTSADDNDPTPTVDQYQKFVHLTAGMNTIPTSLANSAGLFHPPLYHGHIARPGMALCGLNPTPYQDNPMQTVISVWGKIYQVNHVPKHQTVGYMRTHQTKRPSRIATLCLGYADGIPWALGPNSSVIINGYEAPFVGRISMDLITIDVTDIPESLAHPGAWAKFHWLDISSVAKKAHRIDYEMLLTLGRRFHRVYI